MTWSGTMDDTERALKYKLDIDLNNKQDTRILELAYITAGSTVLDVGCACGDFGVVLKAVRNCTVYGFEYNEDSARIAEESGAYDKVFSLDLDTLREQDFPDFRKRFDHVVCGDILEHLRDPLRVLAVLKNYLKDDGTLIASVPNIAHASIKANLLCDDFTYTPLGLLDETHIHFFTYQSLAEGLSRVGLRILDCSFSYTSINGWQPNDPYPALSDDIKYAIFNDWHSFVCQYIIKAHSSGEDTALLAEHNKSMLDLNEATAPFYIKNYRDSVLSGLGESSGTIMTRLHGQIDELTSRLHEQCSIASDHENVIQEKIAEISHKGTIIAEMNADMAQILKEKEQEKETSKKQIDELNSEIHELHSSLADCENRLREKLSELKNRSDIIEKQNTSLSQLMQKLDSERVLTAQQKEQISEQDSVIRSMEQERKILEETAETLRRSRKACRAATLLLVVALGAMISFCTYMFYC